MRRVPIIAAGFVLALAGVAGPAFADPPGLAQNPAAPEDRVGNCVAWASSDNIHNGQHVTLGQGGNPSHGTRGNESRRSTPGSSPARRADARRADA
ncbi:hypothetical protein, partial [Motilibacter deserti]